MSSVTQTDTGRGMLQLGPGEHVVYEGEVALQKGFFFARVGQLVLTNERLAWFETSRGPWKPLWPLKPISGEIPLQEIRSADKGNLIDFVGGGTPLRFRLVSGRSKCFWDNEGKLDQWVAAIRRALDHVDPNVITES